MSSVQKVAAAVITFASFAVHAQVVPQFEVQPMLPGRIMSDMWKYLMSLPSDVEWRHYNLPIDIDAKAPDGTKGTRNVLVVDDGFFFCGWKVDIHSASKHSYRADGITGKGFTFISSVAASRNVFNRENAWFRADVKYRAFKVLKGGSVPDCNSDGFSTAASGMNAQPSWGSSSCSRNVLMCKESPQSASIPCGVCTDTIRTP